MDIVVFGATGMMGSRIAAEAASRGHTVTAVSRSGQLPEGVNGQVTPAAADARDPARVAELVKGADVVASALVGPRDGTDPREPLLQLYTDFLSGVRDGGAPRTLIVGGAGTLLVAPGTRLVDLPDFPDEYKPEALAHGALLDALRAGTTTPTWTYISPRPRSAQASAPAASGSVSATRSFRTQAGSALRTTRSRSWTSWRPERIRAGGCRWPRRSPRRRRPGTDYRSAAVSRTTSRSGCGASVSGAVGSAAMNGTIGGEQPFANPRSRRSVRLSLA